MRRILPAVLCLAMSNQALATIQYTINGGTATPLGTGAIALGTLTQDTVIHVYDDARDAMTGYPLNSAPMIEISGNPDGNKLIIFIASEFSGLPSGGQLPDFTSQYTYGVANLGGVRFSTGSEALRASSALVAFIGGDGTGSVTGDVSVGRVQLLNIEYNLSGNVSAWETFGLADAVSVGRVRVGNRISGNITAKARGNGLASNINSVRVTPSTNAAGIDGDIIAEFGNIRQIISSGPIGAGSGAHVPVISATGQVEFIRATADGDSNPNIASALDKSLRMNVIAGTDPLTPLPNWDPQSGTVFGVFDGGIRHVSTKGSITGSIKARNLGYTNINGSGPGSGEMPGIYTTDDITAPIDITYNSLFANIVAANILSPVSIGRQIKGAVIACGNLTTGEGGIITDLSIGFGPAPDPFGFESLFPAGICGVGLSGAGYPVQMALPKVTLWYQRGTQGDGTAIDSLIRAEQRIDKLQVSRMHVLHDSSPGNEDYKFFRPRIESPVIKSLRVDAMDAGVIWSGKFVDAGLPTARPSNQSDWYASVGTEGSTQLTLGCVSHLSDVWVRDFVRSLNVNGDLAGEIHLPNLNANQLVRVSGRIANRSDNTAQLCVGNLISPTDTLGGLFTEPRVTLTPGGPDEHFGSPREFDLAFTDVVLPGNAPWNTPQGAPVGGIYIADPNGIQGQIIVNAALLDGTTAVPNPATLMPGVVFDRLDLPYLLGSSPEQAFYISGISAGAALTAGLPSDPEQLVPYPHDIASYGPISGLGRGLGQDPVDGGAVGIAPFQIHRKDCLPDRGESQATIARINRRQWVLQGYQHAVRIRFYGPIQPTDNRGRPPEDSYLYDILRAGNEMLAPYVPVKVVQGQFDTSGNWQPVPDPLTGSSDFTSRFRYEIPQSTNPMTRDLFIRPLCGDQIPVGLFRVERTPTSQLRCKLTNGKYSSVAGTVIQPPVVLGPRSNYPTPEVFYFEVVEDQHYPCGIADVAQLGGNAGGDGMLTADDLILFLSSFFSGDLAIADLTGLGGSNGNCSVKQPDGQITVDDLIAFLGCFFSPPTGCNDPRYDSFPDCYNEPVPPEQSMAVGGGGTAERSVPSSSGTAAPASTTSDSTVELPLGLQRLPQETRLEMLRVVAASLPPGTALDQILAFIARQESSLQSGVRRPQSAPAVPEIEP